ncbi:anti-sigma factor [Sinorhizobium numidicum]|uniref:Anti-sigma factor n=1 Tax=Sinorhizobium numidicum TaxID=680248 RepID=A0ABY8D0R6_9HYPH|nr:anti-sigma factor [Sinorhizobium numidicum]WEX77824.1 anti-sigma factor [Sinorhizobium numidicum]WEX84483.1 anti-sigma factor [Sinorhizobium numidicum]
MTTQKPESGDSRRDEVIAGEYVLGVLSAEDRRKVEARMATDRNFAAIVIRWQNNLASFDGSVVVSRPRASASVERRISDMPASPGRSPGLWNSLPLWRSLAIASLTAVVVLAASMAGLFSGGTGGRPLMAELKGQGTAVSLVAHFDAGSGRLKLTPVAAASQAEEKSLELWLTKGNAPPISLGVLPQSGGGEIVIAPAMRMKITEGATLTVSVEPLGGSPTGAATGPTIALGTARYL